jgi:hypothetical protein
MSWLRQLILIIQKLHTTLQVTSQIVSTVMAAQKIDFVEGDAITVPGTDEKVLLPRKVTLAELTR